MFDKPVHFSIRLWTHCQSTKSQFKTQLSDFAILLIGKCLNGFHHHGKQQWHRRWTLQKVVLPVSSQPRRRRHRKSFLGFTLRLAVTVLPRPGRNLSHGLSWSWIHFFPVTNANWAAWLSPWQIYARRQVFHSFSLTNGRMYCSSAVQRQGRTIEKWNWWCLDDGDEERRKVKDFYFHFSLTRVRRRLVLRCPNVHRGQKSSSAPLSLSLSLSQAWWREWNRVELPMTFTTG